MTRIDTAPAQGAPCWFDLMSPDVEAAAAFYARLFGWTYDVSGPDYGHYHLAHLDGRAAAGIGQMPAGAGFPSAWTVYMAAGDAGAMAARARELGGAVVTEAFEVPGMGRMAIVRDPGGAVFGLWQPLSHRGFGITHEPGAMGWCEVNVPDAEAARAFYTELLDAEARPLDSDAVPATYYVLSKDGDAVGGILGMNEDWQGVPPHWMPYFEVEETDAVAEAAKDAGGQVSVAPFDTEYGRIAVVTDPFGAVFSVNGPQRG